MFDSLPPVEKAQPYLDERPSFFEKNMGWITPIMIFFVYPVLLVLGCLKIAKLI